MYCSENMLEPVSWMNIFFQAERCVVNSGIVPPISFVLILIDVITSLKYSSPEEVIATHNKHCQGQESVTMSITPSLKTSWPSQTHCMVQNLKPAQLSSTHGIKFVTWMLLSYLSHTYNPPIFAAICSWSSTIPCLTAASLGPQ